MTSQPGKQTSALHILHNISRNKGNRVMEFGQLSEYNIRNIFYEKPYTRYSEQTIHKSFFKKSKLGISLDQ